MAEITLSEAQRHKDEIITALSSGEDIRLTKEVERYLGMYDTYYLCKHILQYNKLNETFHRAVCMFHDLHLQENQLHLHPRGHYKSTIFTVAAKTRLVLLNPEIRILILTNTQGNAESFLKEIKEHFISNEKFTTLYPEHAITRRKDQGRADYFTTPARQKKWIRMPSIQASSVGTGYVSRHYDFIHYDDIVDNKNISTPEMRQKILDEYSSSLALCDGKTVTGLPWHHVVGTRWHMDDAYHHMIEMNKNSDPTMFHVLITAAYRKIQDEKTGTWNTELLFPEEFTMEGLDQRRKSCELQGNNLFSCNYLNNPIPSDNRPMDPEYLKLYKNEDLNGTPLHTVITVDPSPSDKVQRGDPTVISVFSMDADSNIYVRQVRRGWWNLNGIIQQIFEAQAQFGANQVGVESVSFSKWLCWSLDQEKMNRRQHFIIEPIKRDPGQKKYQRLERIIFPLRSGKIHILHDEIEADQIRREMGEYPVGRWDDFLDTLTDAIELLRAPMKKQSSVTGYRMPPQVLHGSNNFQTGYSTRRR